MRIALVVTRMTDENLRLAAQVGVTDIVGRYPGPRRNQLAALCERVERHGMRLSVLEGYIPHGDVVRGGPGRDRQIASYQQMLGQLGECGVLTSRTRGRLCGTKQRCQVRHILRIWSVYVRSIADAGHTASDADCRRRRRRRHRKTGDAKLSGETLTVCPYDGRNPLWKLK